MISYASTVINMIYTHNIHIKSILTIYRKSNYKKAQTDTKRNSIFNIFDGWRTRTHVNTPCGWRKRMACADDVCGWRVRTPPYRPFDWFCVSAAGIFLILVLTSSLWRNYIRLMPLVSRVLSWQRCLADIWAIHRPRPVAPLRGLSQSNFLWTFCIHVADRGTLIHPYMFYSCSQRSNHLYTQPWRLE